MSTMREKCSCGASFELDDEPWSAESLLEQFDHWRINHRHDRRPEATSSETRGSCPMWMHQWRLGHVIP